MMSDEQLQQLLQLNPLIERAERALAALSLRVQAAVPLADGQNLVFGKVGNEWRLHLVNDEGTVHMLCSASRRARLEALRLLPELVAALRAEQAVQVTEARSIMNEATAYIEQLEQSR